MVTLHSTQMDLALTGLFKGEILFQGNGSNTVHVAWGEAGVGKLSFVEINSLGCQSDTISVEISISWGVGVNEANNKIFKLFPNPSNEKANNSGIKKYSKFRV